MKCISCAVEINPQWQHAIDMNVCPFCGKHIMEEHLKNLFASLRETMSSLQKYQGQLNDWMLSNHNYIKTDSPDIGKYMPEDMIKELKKVDDDRDFQKRKESQKFTVKVKTENGEEEVEAQTLQSEDKTSDFFKRAEVIRPSSGQQQSSQGGSGANGSFQSPAEKTQHLKKVAQQIRREGSQGLTMNGSSMGIPAEMLETADPEAVAEFQSMMSGGEITSSLDSGDGDDGVPNHILAANQALAARKGKGGASNAADLLKLQQMQERVKNSRDNFESGENRGGKGGGFSRA